MLQKTTILILLLTYTNYSFSQKKNIDKANNDFDRFAYIDAREIYLKVIEDGYGSAEIYKKLGDTYYFNSDYKNASDWYRRLLDKYPNEIEPKYYYRTAQSLKSINEYEESDKLMQVYAKKGGKSFIVENFKKNPDYLKKSAFNAKKYRLDKVSINTPFSDFGPSFYLDKLVFASSRENTKNTKIDPWNNQSFLDLYVADMDQNGNLSNVQPLEGDINTPIHESSTAFTKDGQTVYFTKNNLLKKKNSKYKTMGLKLYRATLKGENNWTDIIELPFNSQEYSVAHPALSLDEKRLYFSSDMPGTLGMSDLWYVDILGDNTYSNPINLGNTINTEARESFPFISNVNNLYFSSDGRPGYGGYDIFVVPLNKESVYGEVVNLGEPVNSNQDDFGFIIDENKHIGFLSSNRNNNTENINDNIYRIKEDFTKKKDLFKINGVVIDKDSEELLPDALVVLLDKNNVEINRIKAGTDGRYSFEILAEFNSQYSIRGTKDQYEPSEQLIGFSDVTTTIETVLTLKLKDRCPPNDLGCRLSLQPIYFDFNEYNIRPDASIELAKILAAMRKYPELNIKIESHTDSRGSKEYNLTLSSNRAKSTMNWFIEHGINKNRIIAKGYGESQLINRCADNIECSDEENQLNRRSMFIIVN